MADREPGRTTTLLTVCVVGAGRRFLSGPSYYTHALANAMSQRWQVSLITMRQLLPTRLYPGHQRVGMPLTSIKYDPSVSVCDGVDWHWMPSIFTALRFLRRERPAVVIFQWWTGAVLHSYVLLAVAARVRGARVVVEFHETLDPGEARLQLVRRYVNFVGPLLMRLAHGYAVHAAEVIPAIRRQYRLGRKPVHVIPMGPFDLANDRVREGLRGAATEEARAQPLDILFFGLIRPYKGVEDLVRAFDAIPVDRIEQFHLTIVGETWEGWTEPMQLVQSSRYRDRITFVNRYVTDAEAAASFSAADAVCLPYRRSSGSGSLIMAMGYGLPVIVTDVPALLESTARYHGATVVPVGDVARLRDALLDLPTLRGRRYPDPNSWQTSLDAYARLFDLVSAASRSAHPHPVVTSTVRSRR